MNDTLRRWLSIDGLVTLILAANWIWFAYLLAVITWPFLFPAESAHAGAGGQTSSAAGADNSSGLSQFEISRADTDQRRNDNPWLLVLAVALTLSSVLMTLSDSARRRGNRMIAMIGLGGCASAGMGFVAIQIYRFAEPGFASVNSIHVFVLWERAEVLSLNLLAGLGLLILSGICMLVRTGGETPSLVEQAAAWHWHALDTFWLVLVAFAWHWGVMEGL